MNLNLTMMVKVAKFGIVVAQLITMQIRKITKIEAMQTNIQKPKQNRPQLMT